jgi:hypothetical protein
LALGFFMGFSMALGFFMGCSMALAFFMATFMDGMATHRRLGFAMGQLGCLEQWLQLQTLEMAKVTGQALECHIWLHT